MKNKTLIVIMMVLTAVALALFAYASTLEGDAGQARTYSFPTATPTAAPAGGWWEQMPTPISVEGMPFTAATPTKKP